jgi:tetratricopeptide (TPR) repeat protein
MKRARQSNRANSFFRELRRELRSLLPLFLVIALYSVLLTMGSAHAQTNSLDQRLEAVAGLIRDNRIQEAARRLTGILKFAPNDVRALNLLGTVRAQQGRLGEAELLFLRVRRIDRNWIPARMNLAHLYLLKREPQKTIGELKEVLRLDPGNTEAAVKVVPLMLGQNQLDECINLIEQLKSSQTVSATLLIMLGDSYLRKRNPDRAEENYRLVLDQQNDDADAVLGLAQVSQLRGDDKTASSYLTRSKGLAASSPDTLYRFALVALKSGADQEANTALKQALRIKPDEPAYLILLGATWLEKPDIVEAEQTFRRALQVQPDNAQGQMYLGYCLLKQKKYVEAREWLEKSIQKDNATPESYYYLGLIAQQRNDDAQAVALHTKAIQLLPSYAQAHVALGAIYLKLKDYPRAKQELELAVKLNPDEPEAHYNLAVLFARLKDPERAQEEMLIVEKLQNAKGGQSTEPDAASSSEPKPPQ